MLYQSLKIYDLILEMNNGNIGSMKYKQIVVAAWEKNLEWQREQAYTVL